MKKIIQIFSLILSVLSLIFFLYGSIKLYRIESGNTLQNIESGIPGFEIVQPSNLLTRENVQGIIALSVAGFVIGIGGYVISSNMKDKLNTTNTGETQDSEGTTDTGTQEPEKGQEINEQPTEDTSDTEKTSVESPTESSTEKQQEENQEINQQPTENTSDTQEQKSNDSPENS